MMPAETYFPFPSKKLLWTGYVMSALPALLLLLSGMMKLVKPSSVIEGFVRLGYDDSLALGIGSSNSFARSCISFHARLCSAQSCSPVT